jgi:hypothetical protein
MSKLGKRRGNPAAAPAQIAEGNANYATKKKEGPVSLAAVGAGPS